MPNSLDAWPIFYNLSAQGNIGEIIKIGANDPKISSLILHFDQFRYLRRALGREVEKHMKVLIPLMVAGCAWAREKAKKQYPSPFPWTLFWKMKKSAIIICSSKKSFRPKAFPYLPMWRKRLRLWPIFANGWANYIIIPPSQ